MSKLRTFGVAAASVAATLSLTLAGQAVGHNAHHSHHGVHAVPAPPAVPVSDAQIQNIDQVKTAIKGYYGDTVTATPDPVDGATVLHAFNPDGSYAHQMRGVVGKAKYYLWKRLSHRHHGHRVAARGHTPKAIVLDVDDTSLNTFSYEIYSNFVYNPTTNAAFVNAGVFPGVPGMAALATWAQSKGYTVFFLTGRPETQRGGTTSNLGTAGFPAVPADHMILKDYTVDTWLSSCAPSCTTIQYKSLSRQHIESLGYHIVANFGDQFSDLEGGFADKTFKIPNPMYFLP